MSKRFPVCINVSASLTHLEMVQFDYKQGVFWVMDTEPFPFDQNSREMEYDEETFMLAIKRLYTRNKIPLRTPTYLVLPSFFTRQYTPSENYDDPADLEIALVSEVERFYVFKSVDPKVGYAPAKGNQLLYTAYPLTAIQSIESVFNELKIPLVSIDCSYTSILRGLVTLGLVEREVSEDLKWALVVLSDTAFFMAVIEGKLVEKVVDSPIDGGQGDNVLNDIAEDFKQFCGFEVLNKVIIVNNSEKFFSTKLLEVLEFDGPKDIFDQNPNTLKTFGNEEAAYPSSLEAVGGVLIKYVDYVPALDMSSPESQDVGADDDLKSKIALGIGLTGALLYGGQMGIGQMLEGSAADMSRDAASVQSSIDQQLGSLKQLADAKQKFYIKKVLDSNISFNNVLIKIAEALPPDAWLQNLKLSTDPSMATFNLLMSGATLSSGTVDDYANELATQIPEGAKLIPSIKPVSKDGNRYFEFSIKTDDPNAKT